MIMTQPPPTLWRDAMDHAAGRRHAPEQVASAPWIDLARRVLDARRRVLAGEPVPATVLRRAQGLFAEQSRSTRRPRLEPCFDSWLDLTPAARGTRTSRLLRFEVPGVVLDVQMTRTAHGARVLQLAVAPPDVRVDVHLRGPASEPVTPTLDAHGTGRLDLDADQDAFTVCLHDGDRGLFETPELRWD